MRRDHGVRPLLGLWTGALATLLVAGCACTSLPGAQLSDGLYRCLEGRYVLWPSWGTCRLSDRADCQPPGAR